METNKKPTILSPQQQVVLNRLLPVARVATNGCRDDLPIQPLTSTLIVGPSGNGKSFIAAELGKRLSLPVLRINVSSWVVLSARNEPWTFSSIVQWVYSLQGGGGILVLDEADKLQGTGDWVSCIRHEAHDLLDFVIPLAARMPAAPTDDAWGIPDPPMFVERALLEKQLRERVFILACGAWQSAWRGNSRKLGFSQDELPVEPPSCEQILQSIEPELRQRFRHEVCWLTTLWEGWGIGAKGFGGGTSNHAWSGGPLTIMSQYFAGVAPTSLGFSTYSVLPQMGSLNTISAKVASVKGDIAVQLANTKKLFSLDLSSPVGTRAKVGIPLLAGETITEVKANGKAVWKAGGTSGTMPGVRFIEATARYLVFAVDPGQWSFTARKSIIAGRQPR